MKKRLPVFPILLCALTLFAFTAVAQHTATPYNENQDVRADLKGAIEKAAKENKHIMVQLGGNWCPWCLRFHALISGVPQLDSLMKADYVYMLLNVPREKPKRDYELFKEYDYPNRFGYPVFLILDKTGKRLNTQDSDAFEYFDPKVKGYDTTKVVRFLKMWSPKALDPASYQKL